MIDAKELRAGNFVYWNEKVYCIAQNLECLAVMPDLYPIPINEFWLIKLGFVRFGKDEFKKEAIYFNQLDAENFMCFLGTHCIKNIKYVHQLQNLFFLLYNVELICN